MGVHDEETKSYFKNSAVRCVLAPRYADTRLSWVRQQVRYSLKRQMVPLVATVFYMYSVVSQHDKVHILN